MPAEPPDERDACPGCGADLPVERGPTHAYMEASPACWARAGELFAREFGDPAEHADLVHSWAGDAWAAWELHHMTVRGWLAASLG